MALGDLDVHKPGITAAIAAKTGLSKTKAGEVLNAMTDEIIAAMADNQTVSLKGLGIFSQQQSKSRRGTHPVTGLPLEIPASKRVRFKASQALKNAVK